METKKEETKICPFCKQVITKIVDSGYGGKVTYKCGCGESQSGFGNGH